MQNFNTNVATSEFDLTIPTDFQRDEKISHACLFATLCICLSRQLRVETISAKYQITEFSPLIFHPDYMKDQIETGKSLRIIFRAGRSTKIDTCISQTKKILAGEWPKGLISNDEFISVSHEDSLDEAADVYFVYGDTLSGSNYGGGPIRIGANKRNDESATYKISLSYDRTLFEPSAISALELLWNKIIQSPYRAVSEVHRLSDKHSDRILKTFNNTAKSFPLNESVINLLREHEQNHSNETAVVYGDESLTFRGLVEKSIDLGLRLRNFGVSANDCVGLFIEPSINLIIGTWGILFAGGAYLPLSTEYPDERLKYIAEDSKTEVILTNSAHADRIRNLVADDIKVINIEGDAGLPSTAPFLALSEPSSSDIAYVIYTSGSTGQPKGVLIEHQSIANQMQWLKLAFNFPGNRVLQKTPMSFDAAQWEILAPCIGMSVAMGYPGIYKNTDLIIDTIRKHRVTILQCVPTLLRSLIARDDFRECHTLRQIFCGGEVLSKQLAMDCLSALPDASLTNLYGPTECTINSSYFSVTEENILQCGESIPIGKPISNTSYYVLDDCLMPLGEGEVGELHIAGKGLARGYLLRDELTRAKFINNQFLYIDGYEKLYKTGDLVCWQDDGNLRYLCRTDNQVKIRGYRVELDEIRAAIEVHNWIKQAAVIIKTDPHSGYKNLLAFIELDEQNAPLMDQGKHDQHHKSKESKAQVLAQLSNSGCRDQSELRSKTSIALPGKVATELQRQTVFSRKSYRFFEGGQVLVSDILNLIRTSIKPGKVSELENLSFTELGQIMRYFGAFYSTNRLLPKYGYASPGALYATQIYIELRNLSEIPSGYYYYHPIDHLLVLMQPINEGILKSVAKLHFVGKRSAIESIYRNNVCEVLEIETGHILGLFDEILPEYGLAIGLGEYNDSIKNLLRVSDRDHYIGTFGLVSSNQRTDHESCDLYIHSMNMENSELSRGTYIYKDDVLKKISQEVIRKQDVIAINQSVYERASFGISIVNRSNLKWMEYIALGRELQHFQMNSFGIGLMSSGYSSKTDNDLGSAKRLQAIHAAGALPSYFALGGKVSADQVSSDGMKEDAVHTRGPAEIVRDDLAKTLPSYMNPNKIIALEKLPITANGKIDYKQLANYDTKLAQRELISPRNAVENIICEIWRNELKVEEVSIYDNFFELGGDSLSSVSMVISINHELNSSLDIQVVFEAPTIEKLAMKIAQTEQNTSSRLIPLHLSDKHPPTFCWPGLGGYCMNLRLLAKKLNEKYPFYGIQALGINDGEQPVATIQAMASADVELIRHKQSCGPYHLWGYSFGARVAFEAACQMEAAGDIVAQLVLLAPGSPRLDIVSADSQKNESNIYSNPTSLTILLSVFIGSITGDIVTRCLKTVSNEMEFVNFVKENIPSLDFALIKRISNFVSLTYKPNYSINERSIGKLRCPVTIVKAKGDDYSFIDEARNFSHIEPKIFELRADHYDLLRSKGVEELVKTIATLRSA